MKKVDVVLGLQWGDEGKGKMIDVLTPNYEVVARFQGGPNAGHTLEFEGQKYVLRSIPSGIFQGGKVNIIGNGVVLDPILFKEEATALAASGHDLTKRLYISKKAHLIMPTHRMLDAAYEAAKGSAKIGTTGNSARGIALYDTACEVIRLRDNAADKFLEVVTPTDIAALLRELPTCLAIITTGQKAAEIVAEQFGCSIPSVGTHVSLRTDNRCLDFWRLPSTSRAYPLSLEKKAEAYRKMWQHEGIL